MCHICMIYGYIYIHHALHPALQIDHLTGVVGGQQRTSTRHSTTYFLLVHASMQQKEHEN
jgi:hypothetical protein